jgi:hypothetical protein
MTTWAWVCPSLLLPSRGLRITHCGFFSSSSLRSAWGRLPGRSAAISPRCCTVPGEFGVTLRQFLEAELGDERGCGLAELLGREEGNSRFCGPNLRIQARKTAANVAKRGPFTWQKRVPGVITGQALLDQAPGVVGKQESSD